MKYLPIILFVFAGTVLAHGSHYDAPDHHDEPLFQAMGTTDFLEIPLSPIEAVEASEVIVRGTIESITEGRTLESPNGYSFPMHTLLFKLKVKKVLKGEVGEYVYFEYLFAPGAAKDLNKRKYKRDILVMLRHPGWEKGYYTIVNSEDGLMDEVDVLYTLTTQRGLFHEKKVNDKLRVAAPLVGGDPMLPGATLQQLEKGITASMESHQHGFDID